MLSVTFICDQCMGVAVAMYRACAKVPDMNLITSMPPGWFKLFPQGVNKPEQRQEAKHLCDRCSDPLRKTGQFVNLSSN